MKHDPSNESWSIVEGPIRIVVRNKYSKPSAAANTAAAHVLLSSPNDALDSREQHAHNFFLFMISCDVTIFPLYSFI